MHKSAIRLTDIYWIAFVIGAMVLAWLSLSTLNVLNENIDREAAIELYREKSSMLSFASYATLVVLLVLSNIIYFRSRNSVYFVLTNLVFIGYTLVYYLYISKAFAEFKEAWKEETHSLGILVGVVVSLGIIILSSINFSIISRMTRGQPTPDELELDEEDELLKEESTDYD